MTCLSRIIIALLLVSQFLLPALLRAQPAGFEAAFNRFEADEQLRYGTAAICLLDAASGKVLYANRENEGMVTASSLKVITSATALALLGPDYRYTTKLSYSGRLGPDKVLRGDIIIQGAGDPTLGSWRWAGTSETEVLRQWVAAVKAAGITRIEGNIVADERLMESQTLPDGWSWNDIGNYYGAGAAALNWRENQFDILLDPGSPGTPVTLRGTRPSMDYLQFQNELKSGAAGSGDQAYVYLPPYRELAYLRGTFAIDQREKWISAAVPDPGFECSYRVLKALETAGIEVSGSATTSRRLKLSGRGFPPVSAEITQTLSPPLKEIIQRFNDKSINLYGESLVKRLAIENGKPGSTASGVEVIRDFWENNGIPPASLHMIDGSGLSPGNRVTAASMAKILRMARGTSWYGDFHDALPVQNGMRMKSGYISGVRAYAGYHTSAAGRSYVFAFIVNNFDGSASAVRRKMWAVLDLLK